MLLSPERSRTIRDAQIIIAYLTGTGGGALLTVLAVWILSGFTEPLPRVARVVLLVTGTAFVWAAKHGPLTDRVWLPENRRQIPSIVFAGPLPRAALRFGFEMGTGVRTYVPTMAPYVLLLTLLVVQPTLLVALASGVGFAIGRTAPLVLRLVTSPQRQEAFALSGRPRSSGTAAGLLVLTGAIALV